MQHTPFKAINKAWLRVMPMLNNSNLFISSLTKIVENIVEKETNDFLKTFISYLKKIIYFSPNPLTINKLVSKLFGLYSQELSTLNQEALNLNANIIAC